ncbi:MAG: selenocysteine-specific translation elongation factor [Spirochaetales bacterium]|nr:selenocysteine-specific translation elongation factor [Spirochaetales bacterium]
MMRFPTSGGSCSNYLEDKVLHIIGTAGHVDHGKTALIEALTGINADRLPEEKKRGMTIDLGFAYFEGSDGETVGVIDVPGHERFIRNMVAGAWSLSCAVLVVAGTEGWMQQSEDHARVLEAMGIEHIICAVTKTDLVEQDLLEYVIELTKENLLRIFGKEVAIIPVSPVTGAGIDKLRNSILDLLRTLPEKRSRGSGFIHIDRVFTIKGSGTVITGSLAGGKLSEGDAVTILPDGITARIRGIQSYYSSIQTADPVSRVACNLQGLKKEQISRGCIAAKNPEDFQTGREFIVQWKPLDQDRKIKNHMELEFASGTGHHTGTIHFLRTDGLARIVVNERVSVSWLAPCLFIRQGGHHILGKGCFVWPGKTDRQLRIRLSSILEKYPVPDSIREEPVLRFLLNKWYTCSSKTEIKAIKRFVSAEKLKIRSIGSTLVLEEFLSEEAENLTRMCSKPGGIKKAEYLQSGDFTSEIRRYLIDRGITTYRIAQKDQILISPEQLGDDFGLSPLGKKILKKLDALENRGLQLKEITEPGAKTELRNLVRIEKAVVLEGDIFFSKDRFNALTRRILDGLSAGSVFSIPEAKEKTGLTRRYMIPLLNKMEEKGMVKREGDCRIVC